MQKKQYKIIFISGLAVLALFLMFSQTQKNIFLQKSTVVKTNKSPISNISITLKISDTTLKLTFPAGQSLYDAFISAKENKQLEFSGKNYPALGFFVTDIGSLRSGNGKYLFYYINGKEASVGVSFYLPKEGDVIEWKLK